MRWATKVVPCAVQELCLYDNVEQFLVNLKLDYQIKQ